MLLQPEPMVSVCAHMCVPLEPKLCLRAVPAGGTAASGLPRHGDPGTPCSIGRCRGGMSATAIQEENNLHISFLNAGDMVHSHKADINVENAFRIQL